MTLAKLLSSQIVRYFCVVISGLIIDLGIGWTLANFAGLPLVYGAAVGFFAGAVFNYVLHEFWTFKADDSRLSLKRAVLYVVMIGVTLVARLGVVAVLTPLASGKIGSLSVLIAAVGVSFVVNYLLSRFVIYRR